MAKKVQREKEKTGKLVGVERGAFHQTQELSVKYSKHFIGITIDTDKIQKNNSITTFHSNQ